MAEATPAAREMPWRAAPVAFWLAAGGAFLWVVGVLLPWAEFAIRIGSPLGERFVEDAIKLGGVQLEPSGYGLGTNIGLEPDEGKVVLVLGVAFAVLFVLHLLDVAAGRALPVAMLAVGVIGFLVVAVELGDLWDARDVPGIDLDVGAGVWVALVGTVAATAGSIAYARVAAPPPPAP